jgi:serine/threonine protein phosphatase 1
MELEKRYGRDKVIVLAGNHEDMAVSGEWSIGVSRFDAEPLKSCPKDAEYIKWMKSLRRYYSTDRQIFCHAGVDEEAGDLWEWGTNDYVFTQKYPATFGKFYKDIIAGHIGTADISGDRSFHDIYYDGKSHYYIDGTAEKSGVIPVLKYHTDTNRYYQATPSRDKRIYTYEGLF